MNIRVSANDRAVRVPELFRQVHCRIHSQAAICSAAEAVRVVFVLDRACTRFELAEEEVVEGLVFSDVRLEELIKLDAVGFDKRWDIANRLWRIVCSSLLWI